MSPSDLIAKFAVFAANVVPIAIVFTTMVCLFAVLYAGGEMFYRRFVCGDTAARSRPSALGVLLILAGTAAILICGRMWLGAPSPPEVAFEIAGTQFTAAGLYLMASSIVFDVGAVLLLCSDASGRTQSETTA